MKEEEWVPFRLGSHECRRNILLWWPFVNILDVWGYSNHDPTLQSPADNACGDPRHRRRKSTRPQAGSSASLPRQLYRDQWGCNMLSRGRTLPLDWTHLPPCGNKCTCPAIQEAWRREPAGAKVLWNPCFTSRVYLVFALPGPRYVIGA